MNRKLRNTLLALSVTGLMLAVGVMAAKPVLPEAGLPADTVAHTGPQIEMPPAPLIPVASAEAEDRLVADIEAHGLRYEQELAQAASMEQALAASAGFVAAATTEAVLAQVLAAQADAAAEAASEAAGDARKHKRGVRRTIAVPYFSFARGTGRGDRS